MTNRQLILFIFAVAVVASVLAVLALDDDLSAGPSDRNSEDVRSFCDEHGHRVYVSEDDTHSSPAIFVLPSDCAGGR